MSASSHCRLFRLALVPLAVAAALEAPTAHAGVHTAHQSGSEPLHLVPERGWLDAAPAQATGGDRAAIARDALGAHAAKSGADASAITLHRGPDGSTIAQTRESFDGIEVFGARRNVLIDRALTVRAITGSRAALAPSHAKASAFALDGIAALRHALGTVDGLAATGAVTKSASSGAFERYTLAASPGFVPVAPARAKRVWYPAAAGLLPAWYVELAGLRPGEERPVMRAVVVSAEDGRRLYSRDLVNDAQPHSYRVFANAQGYPYVDPYGYTNPHPTGVPDGWRPTVPAPMNLVTWAHSGISTGDPWLPDGATATLGNNVDAFYNARDVGPDGYCAETGGDFQFDAASGDVRAPLSGTRAFDYAYDVNATLTDYEQCPRNQPAVPLPATSPQFNAKIVQAFYMVNWLHDYFYDLGFNELASNMQVDNYGRGGVGGDPMHIMAGAWTTFAYASPEDGGLAGLSLGFNSTSRSRRDVTALDFGVLSHEWAHTMFGRLTSMWYTGQQGSLNEGTADFVGMLLTVRAQDRPFGGAYAVGGYMNLDYRYGQVPPETPDNSYWHGIRRFPHSLDLSVNPLTFRHIGMDAPYPGGFDWKLRTLTNAEPHTAGEIWTAALWQCSGALLAAAPANAFDATRKRFLGHLVAGLKLMPADATYTEARDALLASIRAGSEADYRLCRAGFAQRGLGAGAVSPPRFSIRLEGTVESFLDAERALSITGIALTDVGGDADGVLDRGENGRLSVTVLNSGFSPTSTARVTFLPRPDLYTVVSNIVSDDVALAPGESHTVTFDVRMRNHTNASTVPFDVIALDRTRPWVFTHDTQSYATNYDLVRDATVDTVAADATFAPNWTWEIGPFDYIDFCYLSCVEPWVRGKHNGVPAYVIGHPHAMVDSTLASRAFTVSATQPLTVTVRHDYDFDRRDDDPLGWPGAGSLEIRVDGGEWEPASNRVASGETGYTGMSNGWRNDTIVFDTTLAGRTVELRWYASTNAAFYDDPAYWAISRVEVTGATQPPFVRVHPE